MGAVRFWGEPNHFRDGFRLVSLGGWGQPGPLGPERLPLRSGFELMPVCWTGGRSAARVVSLRISSTAFAGLSADAMFAGFRAPRFANDWRRRQRGNQASRQQGGKAKKPRSMAPRSRAHYGCTGERHCGAWLGFVWSLIQLWPAGTKGGWSAADRANSTTLVTDLYLIVGTVPKAFCRVPSPCAGRRSRSAELGV